MADDLLERIRVAAEISVGRAVGFAALAIGCVVVGLSSDPRLALRSGALLSLLTAAILCLHALAASRRSYRRTEIWLLIDKPRHLQDAVAQRLIGTALGNVLRHYARWCGVVGVLFWLASLAWSATIDAVPH